MISTKKHIQQLAAILHAKQIEDIIISPGSRSGPLVHTFANSVLFNCRSIVDERSAGYFATGLAQARQKPVVLVCSSGTATLNYSPAVAEAFYQNIPLVVLTADRPFYWIDQGENQCIRQQNIYNDFVKKELTLPMGESERELWFAAREINECLNIALSDSPGPVHINIPMEEPLHDLLDEKLPDVKIVDFADIHAVLQEKELEYVAKTFNSAEKVLILIGQQNPNPHLEKLLAELVEKTGAVVLKEQLSNLNHSLFCGNPDVLFPALLSENISDFQPDLLISFGGSLVSKPLKQFLRQNKPVNHWQVDLSGLHKDTYLSLNRVFKIEGEMFLKQLSPFVNSKSKKYLQRWKEKKNQVVRRRDDYVQKTGFCDLTAFQQVLNFIPAQSVVHLGNSSPVRYVLLFEARENIRYFSNRGTSGIDGCLSTAVGFASQSEIINTVILGDLSFFYDSNALWNKYIGSNLRVIVMNNRGGNIFSMIKGPENSPAFKEFFFTENRFKVKGMAKTFNLDYFSAKNKMELESALQEFYSPKQKNAALLEVFTDAELNAAKYRELFNMMK